VNAVVEGYEVDAHWPDARLIVELDGWEFHSDRQSFEKDRERDAVLQSAGWRVVRVTDRQLGAPTAARLQRMRDHAGAGSRSGLTSEGAPRSGNGTSIASKSRGTTVSGKIARASSRTSRAK